MEYIIEFILELVLEGSIEASRSNKVPKYIRYPLIFLISLFFIAVIGLIVFTGVIVFKDNALLGSLFILIGVLMFVMCVIKFRKAYLIKVDKK